MIEANFESAEMPPVVADLLNRLGPHWSAVRQNGCIVLRLGMGIAIRLSDDGGISTRMTGVTDQERDDMAQAFAALYGWMLDAGYDGGSRFVG
jgi:hypothetical protein